MRIPCAVILVLATASAAVAVDLTGVWRARLHAEGFPDDFCTWALAQSSAGDVVGYQTGCLLPQNSGPISGTIDAGTGAFHLFFDVPGDPACPSFTVDATLPPGGTAFAGTFDCPAFPLIGTIDSVSRCGDGVVEGMESCDPGTADVAIDCCTFDCHLEGVGRSCDSDGTICTTQTCDVAGNCVTSAVLADGAACADDPCMTDQSCVGGACSGGVPAGAGIGCDLDGNACTRDACDGAGSCTAGACSPCCDAGTGCNPRATMSCKQASIGGAKVLLKDATPDDGDKLTFGWKGEATGFDELGDPLGSTSYDLCIYHVIPPPLAPLYTLVLDASAPAGGTCGEASCWRSTTLGYKYTDKETTPDGLSSAAVIAGEMDRAKIKIKGRGRNLPDSSALATRAFGIPVTARLIAGSECWEATFANPARNGLGLFKAKNR